MYFDFGIALFIILAMIAGYLAGGFREILKFIILISVFSIFKIPSIETAMKDFAGPRLYTSFYVIVFIATYFVIYWIFFLSLKGLIKEREGTLGDINKTIGIIAGFFRGIAILTVAVYILKALFKKNLLIELKPYAVESLFYNITSTVLEKIGLIFF